MSTPFITVCTYIMPLHHHFFSQLIYLEAFPHKESCDNFAVKILVVPLYQKPRISIQRLISVLRCICWGCRRRAPQTVCKSAMKPSPHAPGVTADVNVNWNTHKNTCDRPETSLI